VVEITDRDVVRCVSVFRGIKQTKLKVLLYLRLNPCKSLETIVRRLKYRAQLIEQAVEHLEEQKLITKVGVGYKLTTAGEKLTEAVIDLIATMKEERYGRA